MALFDRSTDRLAELFPELVGSSDHLFVTGVDSTNLDSVKTGVAKVIERFGRIDVLINLVGGFKPGAALHETPVEMLDFLLNLNMRTLFNACQAVIPSMLAHGSGKIIGVAARRGLKGTANNAADSAAKSAVIRMIESMADELRSSNINVNCVIPGTLDTPQNRQGQVGDPGKFVQPESIADVIVFLCSEMARDIHGVTLPVYGLT